MNPMLEVLPIATNNYVAFSFFVGTMAMMASSAFFFFELNNVPKKWCTSVLVSGPFSLRLLFFLIKQEYTYKRQR